MGDYKETDFLTSFPIHEGEPVVMFIGVPMESEYEEKAKSYYVGDSFKPLCPCLTGKYDGYGMLDDGYKCSKYTAKILKDTQFYTLEDHFAQKYKEYKQRDIDETLEAICNHKLYVLGYRKYICVSLLFTHKQAYDLLLQKMRELFPTQDDCSKEKINKHIEWITRYKKLTHEFPFACDCANVVCGLIAWELLPWWKNFSTKGALNEMLDFIDFNIILSQLRKDYRGTSGLGAQAADYEFHEILTTWMLEHVKHHIKLQNTFDEEEE